MKVSIITAVFNGSGTIRDALDSVVGQDFEEIEHIVVDGASQDGTVEILERYRSNLALIISEKDKGIYDALNKGIALASGDVIGFLHADDLLADSRVVSRIVAAFADPSVDATYGDLVYVSKSNTHRIVRRWQAGEFLPSRLSWGWMPPHPTFYARRSLYDRLGGFDTRLRIAADYDCMLRFLGRGGVSPTYIPEVLVKMRLGGVSNRSIANIVRKSREDYRALTTNGVGGLGALVWKNLSKVRQFIG